MPKVSKLTGVVSPEGCFDAAGFVGQTLRLRIGPTFRVVAVDSLHVTIRQVYAAPTDYSERSPATALPAYADEHIDVCEFWRWIAGGIIVLSDKPTELETKGKAHERELYTSVRRFPVSGPIR